MTALVIGLLSPLLLGPGLGLPLRWHDRHRAARLAEEARITAPLPAERSRLTAPEPVEVPPLPAGVELVHTGGRETPAPALLAETRSGLGETPPVRGQDREPCADPCTARHCAHHNAPGTAAQNGGYAHTQAVRAALFTPTAEWDVSLLGLKVPGDLSTLYAESEAT